MPTSQELAPVPQLSVTLHCGSAPVVFAISGFCHPMFGPRIRSPLNVVRVRREGVAPGGQSDRAARAGRLGCGERGRELLVVGPGVGVQEDLVAGRGGLRGRGACDGDAGRDQGADAQLLED